MNSKVNIEFKEYLSLIDSQNWERYLKIAMHIANCNEGQVICKCEKYFKSLYKIADNKTVFPSLKELSQETKETIYLSQSGDFTHLRINSNFKNCFFYIQLKLSRNQLTHQQKDILKLGIQQIEDTLKGLFKNAQLNQQNITLSKSRKLIEKILESFGHMTLIFDKDAVINKVFGQRDLLLDSPEEMEGKTVYDYHELAHIHDELKTKIKAHKSNDEVFTIDYTLMRDSEPFWFKAKVKPFTDTQFNKKYFLAFIMNVTEQVKAKKEIEETNELLTETGRLARVGAWRLDINNKRVHCTDVARDILELEDNNCIPVSDFLDFFQDQKSKNQIYRLIRSTLLKKKSHKSEFKIESYKKNEIWINIKINANFKDGNLIKLYGSIQDISNFKKIENELLIEQKRLSHFIEGSDLGAWEWNAITDQSVHNDKWAKILGYEPEDILPITGDKWEKLIHPDDLQKYNYLMAEHLRGETPFYQSEIRLKAKNGKYKWILDRGKVISYDENGLAEKVYGTHRDITKEKLTEVKLKDNLNRFRTIFNFSPIGILLSDFNSANFIEVNQAILNLTGYSKEEFLSFNLWKLPKKSKTFEDKKQLKILSEKGSFGPYEKELIKKNGETFIAMMQGKSFSTSEGEKKVLTIISDITKEKKITKELKDKTKQANLANQAKSEFLANMSHEMKTPLNGIIGFSDLIINSSLSTNQKIFMRTIKSSAQTLRGLITDVLDFSKIEAGKIDINSSSFSLEQILREVIHVVQYLAHEKDLQLNISLPLQLPKNFVGDQLKIKQVLINLINNGIKFTDEGYVKLECEILQQSKEKASVKFSVIDTGKGIQTKNKKKILEAFTQEDSSINREKGGTGLGLTISNKLLKLMGSELKIQSQVGKGSCFSFTLTLDCNSNYNKQPLLNEPVKLGLYYDKKESFSHILEQNQKIIFSEVLDASKESDCDFLLINQRKISHNHEIDLITKHVHPSKIIVLINANTTENILTYFESRKINKFIYQPFLPIDFVELIHEFQQTKTNKDKSKTTKDKFKQEKEYNLNILVAEDNLVNMRLIVTYLNNLYQGIKIIKAENGKEAYELFKKEAIDLVITDIQMPGMNGFVFAKKIRSNNKNKELPIIAITAGNLDEVKKVSQKAGINLCISKPILQNDLQKRLDSFIQKAIDLKAKLAIDFEYLNSVIGSDKKEQKLFLEATEESLNETVKQVEKNIEIKSYKELAQSFHKIKGTLLYLGLKQLAEQAQKLQKSAKKEEQEVLAKGEHLVGQINLLIKIIEEKTSSL